MIIKPRAADSAGGNASRRWSVSARAQCYKPFRSLHSTGRLGAWGHGGRNHQAESLQQLNRALRRSPPNKLASFSLAILHVDIAARILQAAALERAVHEHTIVQDHVLVLEDLILMSIHGITRGPCPRGNTAELRNYDMFQPGHCLRLSRLGWREEAIIHPRWMQADVSPKYRSRRYRRNFSLGCVSGSHRQACSDPGGGGMRPAQHGLNRGLQPHQGGGMELRDA